MSETIDCPKCEHEHAPSGSYEDDSGPQTCDECGFEFHVDIDYDPSYYTSCKSHEWGELQDKQLRSGEIVRCRFCQHCQAFRLADEC